MGRLSVVRGICMMLAVAVLAVAAPAQAADVRLELTEFPGTYGSEAYGVALQPDGKIVVAGSATPWDDWVSRSALARYNADLSLDTSFGDGGLLMSDVASWGSAVMIQADGRIVVAGSAGEWDSDFALTRYLADGSLDWSFGYGGTVTTDLGNSDRIVSAALQPDGKIVVAGGSGWDAAIARYDTDGSLDPAFGSEGVVTHNLGDYGFSGEVAIQPDGKIVVAGSWTVARLQADGSLDTSFASGGSAYSDFYISSVAIQPDGRIVVGGTNGNFTLARYRADGSLDTSFGINGSRTTVFNPSASESVSGLAVQPNGKIVAVGRGWWWHIEGAGGSDLIAALFNADGSLDPSGTTTVTQGPDQGAEAVVLAPNGRIVFAGSGNTWDDGYFGPQRFLVGRLAGEPATTITGGPSGTTSATSATFTFTGTAPFECKLDGPAAGTYSACTSPKTYSGLADGSYTFSVRAGGAAPATRSFRVDTSPPESTITSGPNGPFGFSTGQFSFTSEPGATFECKLDGSYTACTSPKVYSGLADGNYTFSVRARKDGLTETTPSTQSFTVDTVPPDVTITSGPSGTTNQFTWTATGAISHYDCLLTGPGQNPTFVLCTSPRTLGPLANGSYTFSVRATDPAGNARTASRSFTIAAAPDTSITSGPPGLTNATSQSFAFTSTLAGSTFECKLDTPSGAGSYGACTSPRAYTTTANGTYTFSVRASQSGNTDLTPATRSFTVDTVAPETTITSGTTPPFSFTSSESGSTFACKLDAGNYGSCTSPQAYTGLAPGTHTFSVRATDPAGNTDATPATRSFTVAGTAPETTIVTGPPPMTGGSPPGISFTATPAGTFECKLDTPTGPGSYAPCSGTQWLTLTVSGVYTFSVRATYLGVTDPTPATRTFTADADPPETTITGGTTPPFSFNSSESAQGFHCKLDTPAGPGDWSGCSSPMTYTLSAAGTYTFSVRAVDQWANLDPTPATRSFTIQAPTASPGGLDFTFSGDGKQTSDFGSSDYAEAVAVQADGKLVVAGTALARYNADGTLDSSFSGDGRVAAGGGRAVAIQPDGKIVVASTVESGGNHEFSVARYKPDGSPDPSFSADGVVRTDLTGYSDWAMAMAIQPDGNILVVGSAGDDYGLVRYRPDGALDPSFGDGGIVMTAAHDADYLEAVALQPDGRIVVAGGTASSAGCDYGCEPQRATLARYLEDGTLDSSFSDDGLVVTDLVWNWSWSDMVVQADGRIVIGTEYGLARYEADGTLDGSYGEGGMLWINAGAGLVLQDDGKLVVARRDGFDLSRYNADGTLDLTFVRALFSNHTGWEARALAVQPDGKIVAVGDAWVWLNADFAIARWTP